MSMDPFVAICACRVENKDWRKASSSEQNTSLSQPGTMGGGGGGGYSNIAVLSIVILASLVNTYLSNSVMPLISYLLDPIAAVGLRSSEGTTKCLNSNKSSAKWSLTTGGSFLRYRFHMGPNFPAALWQTSASIDMTKGSRQGGGSPQIRREPKWPRIYTYIY